MFCRTNTVNPASTSAGGRKHWSINVDQADQSRACAVTWHKLAPCKRHSGSVLLKEACLSRTTSLPPQAFCKPSERSPRSRVNCDIFEKSLLGSYRHKWPRLFDKIVAIGRNYAEHIKELSNMTPKEPFFFLKPTSSYIQNGGKVEIPHGIIAHHEVELGLVIGRTGRDISQANAFSHIAGYALAVDMTARNLQDQVKKKGLPWSAAKGFDTFTPISEFIPKELIKEPHNLRLVLKINGQIKQNGPTSDMIFSIPRLLEHISSIMTLEEGDLVLTGTPSGVGPVLPGDHVECRLVDPSSEKKDKALATLEFSAVQRKGGYQFKSE